MHCAWYTRQAPHLTWMAQVGRETWLRESCKNRDGKGVLMSNHHRTTHWFDMGTHFSRIYFSQNSLMSLVMKYWQSKTKRKACHTDKGAMKCKNTIFMDEQSLILHRKQGEREICGRLNEGGRTKTCVNFRRIFWRGSISTTYPCQSVSVGNTFHFNNTSKNNQFLVFPNPLKFEWDCVPKLSSGVQAGSGQ